MSRSVLAVALIGVLLAAAGASALGESRAADRVPATVDWVTDGDTLRVRSGERVRLLQIDAPEAGEECYAGRATAELIRLTPRGARVVLESDAALDGRDRYGRLLAYVLRGQANVNVELVRRGAATPYFYDGDRGKYAARLLAALAEARRARRGMWGACRVSWSPENPVTTRSR
jgi:endonuclease YncB( thermonuclease family)